MDVLNTYGGGFYLPAFILFCFCALLALLAVWGTVESIKDEDWVSVVISSLISCWFVFLSAAALQQVYSKPVRHEVTLRPGYVIDATKYEVVEQRGQIYVIEERKGARE